MKENSNFLFKYVAILLNMMDIKNVIFYRSLTFQISNLSQQALVNPSPLITSSNQFVIHQKQSKYATFTLYHFSYISMT